jgi:hypothetical protein
MSIRKKRIGISLSSKVIATSKNYLKQQKKVKTLTALIEKSLRFFLSRSEAIRCLVEIAPVMKGYPKEVGRLPDAEEIKLNREQIEHYRTLGIIDENGIRNLWIKHEFQCRQISKEKRRKYDIINELAAELFMEPKAVEDIIYRKKERKKQFISLIKEIG